MANARWRDERNARMKFGSGTTIAVKKNTVKLPIHKSFDLIASEQSAFFCNPQTRFGGGKSGKQEKK